jgi:Flp pilus assembly protein TadG
MRRAAAVTEFAVVAPVFFLMIVGFIEFARALMVQQVLVNAARVGAREAILASGEPTTQDVVDAVNAYTQGITVNPVTVDVSPSPSAAEAGDMITVTTSVNYIDVSWMPAPWFLGDAVLSSSATMRKEGFE